MTTTKQGQVQTTSHSPFLQYLHVWEGMMGGIIIVAAAYFHYTWFMKHKPGLFITELLVYGASAWAVFSWIRYMRNATYEFKKYWMGTLYAMFVIMVLCVFLELGTVNNYFVEDITEETIQQQSDASLKEGMTKSLEYKDNFIENMVICSGIFMWVLPPLLFSVGWMKGWKVDDFLPVTLPPFLKKAWVSFFGLTFVGSVITLVVLSVLPSTNTFRKDFLVGSGVTFLILYAIAFFILFVYSFRYHENVIKSYFLGKPASRWKITGKFVLEVFVSSTLTAVPVILTAYVRNKTFENDFLLRKDKELWKELPLIILKIAVVYTMGQVFGAFANYNEGMECNKDPTGSLICNRIPTSPPPGLLNFSSFGGNSLISP